jgi:hypothetical protein
MTIGNTGRAALLAALAAGTLLLAGCDHGSSGGSYSNSGYSGGGSSSGGYSNGGSSGGGSSGGGYSGGGSSGGGSSGGGYSSGGYSGGGSSGYSGGSRFTAQPPRGPYTPDY